MKKIIVILLLLFLVLNCDNLSNKSKKTINPKAKKNFLLGNAQYKKSNFSRAISYYTKAISFDKKYVFAYLKRGDCYRKLRKKSAALRDYTTVIKLNPYNSRAYYHRGTLKFKLGKKNSGCKDIIKAKELCYVPAERFANQYCK